MANVQSIQAGESKGNFTLMWGDDGSSVFYNQAFDTLEFPKLQLKNPPQHEYIIYKTETEFEIVQARTALEAMAQSNIHNPFKIVHGGSRLASVIANSKLKKAEETVEEEEVSREEDNQTEKMETAATKAEPKPQPEAKAAATPNVKTEPSPQPNPTPKA